MCVPSATAGMNGVAVQAANAAPSTLHASVAPASAETANAGVVSLVSAPGAAVNAAAGAVRSTVHVYAADPALPAASVARTVTVCAPSARPVYRVAVSVSHAVHAAASRRQSIAAGVSLVVNAKSAVVWFVAAAGVVVSVTAGATVSTTKSYAAGLGSVFPTRSTARTSSACPPSARPGNVELRSHAANTAVSNAHWKPAGRVASNVKSPSRSRVTAPGRVTIHVSGGPALGDFTSQAASSASSGSACDASSTPSPHRTASDWPLETSIVSSPAPASTLRGTGDAAAESVSSPSPSASDSVPVAGQSAAPIPAGRQLPSSVSVSAVSLIRSVPGERPGPIVTALATPGAAVIVSCDPVVAIVVSAFAGRATTASAQSRARVVRRRRMGERGGRTAAAGPGVRGARP